MRVLTKPELENAIMLRELIVIMENFGIYDDQNGEEGDINSDNQEGKPDNQDEQSINEGEDATPSRQVKDKSGGSTPHEAEGAGSSGAKKKKKKKKGDAFDLTQLDDKSIKVLAKIILALMELNVSLYDFFDGAIYEQLVKSKTK